MAGGVRGAIAGAVVGVLLLAIGLMRAAVASVSFSARDVTVMLGYVCAFAAAGAVVGALSHRLGTRGGRFGVGAAAGAVLTSIILTLDRGLPTTWGREVWLTLSICTVILGLFGLRFLAGERRRGSAEPPAA